MNGEYLTPAQVAAANAKAVPKIAADAIPADRSTFIRQTYLHVAGAIGTFTILEFLLFQTGIPEAMLSGLQSVPYSWLAVLAAFGGVGWLASRVASANVSRRLQYAALGAYVLAETVIFMPLLLVASSIGGASVISSAALLTLMLVTGLTVAVFATGADFSWMQPVLCIGGFVALGVIVASMFLGFTLGVLFSAVMVLFAAGCILFDTSNVLHHYRTDQYVGASLELFASIALLFWYVLRIVMSLTSSDD